MNMGYQIGTRRYAVTLVRAIGVATLVCGSGVTWAGFIDDSGGGVKPLAQEVVADGDKNGQASAPIATKPPRMKSAAAVAADNKTFQLVSVSYIGNPPVNLPVLTGFGQDVKMVDAIHRIAPDGWQVFLTDGLLNSGADNQKVSWTGGRTWVDVLDIVGNDLGLSIKIDWNSHFIYVGKKEAVANPKRSVAINEKPAISNWTLTAGHTVGHELKTWAAQAGWHVVWNLQRDWAVPASTLFSGAFPTAAADVIKTLAANGALIHAQFYTGNKTMVVNGPGVTDQ